MHKAQLTLPLTEVLRHVGLMVYFNALHTIFSIAPGLSLALSLLMLTDLLTRLPVAHAHSDSPSWRFQNEIRLLQWARTAQCMQKYRLYTLCLPGLHESGQSVVRGGGTLLPQDS